MAEGEKMENKPKRAATQKNIRIPDELTVRLKNAQNQSGYTITQIWIKALDEYLTRLGY
jgi:predicted DNA-binding protein